MEAKKRVAAIGKKMKSGADDHRRRLYGEKKRRKRGVERCISTPIPNHLSTYQLHQFYYSLFGEYDGAGGVEKRGWKACGGGAL